MKLTFREANHDDLESLVTLLADDKLGKLREDTRSPLNARYVSAFESINTDPNNALIVAEYQHKIVGMLQLTFIPYLTHTGSWRCLVEGVRIHKNYRGQGYGEQMFEYAIEAARVRGCALVQLTSDKNRPDAIKFYERLGFVASHEGFKLKLKKK